MRSWQPLHAGLARCCSNRCRIVTLTPRAVSSSVGTFGGGGGGAELSRFSKIHFPRITGEVRAGYDDTVSTLAWVRMLPRGESGGRATRGNGGRGIEGRR